MKETEKKRCEPEIHKIGNMLILFLLLSAVVIPLIPGTIQDNESISCSVSAYDAWHEWPSEGGYYGSSVRVTIDSTNPSGKHVAVCIVPPYPPFVPYYPTGGGSGSLYAGQSTGWVDTYGQNYPFYVQINYNGDECSMTGHIEWIYT